MTYAWGDEPRQFSIEQSKSIGMLLFGRVTCEGMAAYWTSATDEIAEFMNRVPKVVFSGTLQKAEWSNTRLVGDRAEEEVTRLRQQPGKDLYIFGSANLSATLSRRGRIDEYRLALVPVALGAGTPLFKPAPEGMRLTLLEARPLGTGAVILRYQRGA